MDKPRPIHERVSDLVRESGLDHAAIAKRAGWSERRFSRLLHGQTQFRALDIETLAAVLGKSVVDLYSDRTKAMRKAKAS